MSLLGFFLNHVYVCVLVYVCAHGCKCPQETEEGVASSGVGVKGGCEQPHVEARDQTQDFPKNSKYY